MRRGLETAVPPPPPLWRTADGPDNDVVVSTRCRVARNLSGMPFPWRAEGPELKRVAEAVLEAVDRAGGALSEAHLLRAETLPEPMLHWLLEARYASVDWSRRTDYRWLWITDDGSASLMLNEEDHLRLQVILPGLQVESAYREASEIEALLAESLPFAHSEQMGFLTAALTNAGTGLRISALLHLAGLAAAGGIEPVLEAAAELGCAVRGLYGEGTRGTGELYQVSNRYTFGIDAAQIVGRVRAAADYLVHAEKAAREERFSDAAGREELREAADRALEDLFSEDASHARLLSIISVIRLAVAQGVIQASLPETAEWVALAGLPTGGSGEGPAVAEKYEAIRRTAALRQRLRAIQ